MVLTKNRPPQSYRTHLTKVWPLEPGIPGVSSQGNEVELQPGVPGWMPDKDAEAAAELGQVQVMAGQTPQSLKTPRYETAAMSTVVGEDDRPPGKRRGSNYQNRSMKSET